MHTPLTFVACYTLHVPTLSRMHTLQHVLYAEAISFDMSVLIPKHCSLLFFGTLLCQVPLTWPGFVLLVAGRVHNRGLPICSCQSGTQRTSMPGVCCWALPPGVGLHQEASDSPHDQAAAPEQSIAGKQAAAAEMCSRSCSPAQAGCGHLHLGHGPAVLMLTVLLSNAA